MERPDVEEKVVASERLEPTEEERKDMSFKKSGDVSYWKKRLKSLDLDVPDELKQSFDNFVAGKKQTYKEMSEIFVLISKHQQSLREKYGPTLIETAPSGNLAIEEEQVQIDEVSEEIDDIIKSEIGRNIPTDLSSQEEMDLRMKPEVDSFNVKYWRDRMAQDFELLPAHFKPVATKLVEGKTITTHDRNFIIAYLFQRIKAISNKKILLNIQNRKQETMALLKKRLQDIDHHVDYTEEEKKQRRIISFDHDLSILYLNKDYAKLAVSLGDIAADMDWGIKYAPDDSVPPEMWRKIRKISDFREARYDIEEQFNQEMKQIGAVMKVGAASVDVNYLKKHQEAGYIAERMAKCLLTRIQYNNSDIKFRVENSNVLEDLELKYDFKIILPQHPRGIAVEPEGMSRETYVAQKIGIQFTIGGGRGKEESIAEGRTRLKGDKYKARVRHPVRDIVLLKTSFDAVSAFEQWLRAGSPPGGPEQYLSREQKIEILKKAVQGRLKLSDADINELVL